MEVPAWISHIENSCIRLNVSEGNVDCSNYYPMNIIKFRGEPAPQKLFALNGEVVCRIEGTLIVKIWFPDKLDIKITYGRLKYFDEDTKQFFFKTSVLGYYVAPSNFINMDNTAVQDDHIRQKACAQLHLNQESCMEAKYIEDKTVIILKLIDFNTEMNREQTEKVCMIDEFNQTHYLSRKNVFYANTEYIVSTDDVKKLIGREVCVKKISNKIRAFVNWDGLQIEEYKLKKKSLNEIKNKKHEVINYKNSINPGPRNNSLNLNIPLADDKKLTQMAKSTSAVTLSLSKKPALAKLNAGLNPTHQLKNSLPPPPLNNSYQASDSGKSINSSIKILNPPSLSPYSEQKPPTKNLATTPINSKINQTMAHIKEMEKNPKSYNNLSNIPDDITKANYNHNIYTTASSNTDPIYSKSKHPTILCHGLEYYTLETDIFKDKPHATLLLGILESIYRENGSESKDILFNMLYKFTSEYEYSLKFKDVLDLLYKSAGNFDTKRFDELYYNFFSNIDSFSSLSQKIIQPYFDSISKDFRIAINYFTGSKDNAQLMQYTPGINLDKIPVVNIYMESNEFKLMYTLDMLLMDNLSADLRNIYSERLKLKNKKQLEKKYKKLSKVVEEFKELSLEFPQIPNSNHLKNSLESLSEYQKELKSHFNLNG
jgi:hypothetical protein